ncbi:MAG: hypothetical protein KGP27_01190 [Hyphomicrobiales bacterium]|nr:hypothetical protein [Hyphomicrobiales bacterium]
MPQEYARPDDDAAGALFPRPVRRVVFAVLGLLLASAAYLFIVRGPALLFDLAHMTAAFLCL